MMAPAMAATTPRNRSRERVSAASEPVLSPWSTTSRITCPKASTAPAATSSATAAKATCPRYGCTKRSSRRSGVRLRVMGRSGGADW